MTDREARGAAVAQLAACAAAVFALAWLSVKLSLAWNRVSPIWLPNAIWLVFLLNAPARRWPALLLAGVAGDMLADVAIGDGSSLALGLAPMNLLQVLPCALVLKVLGKGRLAVEQPRVLIGFGLVAAATSVLVAYLGASWIAFHQHRPLPPHWPVRAMANALGMMLFAPPLSVVVEGGLGSLFRPGRARKDAAVMGVVLATLALTAVLPQHPLLLFTAPMMVLAALQLEFAAAALCMLVIAAAFLTFVTLGWTPLLLVGHSPASQVVSLQIFLVVTGAMALPIASVMKRRRELEAELTASRDALADANRLARMAEGLAGTGYWRSDNQRFDWSDQMFEIYGRERALGGPGFDEMVDYVHPEDREILRRHRETYRESDPPELKVRIVRPSGEVRHVVARSRVERDETGAIVARYGTCTDVTEVRQAEAAARDSEERYRFLAESAPDMITRTTLDGRLIYISPGSKRVFGWTPDEMLRQNAQQMVHPEDFERVMEGINRLISQRLPNLSEKLVYRARHQDGRYIWIEANPTLICNDQGEPIEFIDIVRDVTQSKLFEAELDEARRRAEAAAAAKSAFLANMSHELRTPLTSIIGFSRLMGERRDLPSEAKHYSKRISDASEALLAIINDVLDFSKLEAGQVALEVQPLSVSRLMEEATGLFAIQAAAKGLALGAEIGPEMPELVEGDVARLRQVLLNFLSNAVKFTASGSVTARADWRPRRRGGRLRISVSDTGSGISAQNVKRLFERFSQAEVSINRTHGGTGLGLAISKGIVELMGGRIGVDTKPGKGATFWFELPLRIAKAAAPGAEPPVGVDCPSLSILLVDDTAVNRELVKLMLEPLGIAIEEAAGGSDAVKAAMTKTYDLILMDVRMPGVDGLEATRVIRAASEANRTTPILALTADVHPENAAACRAAGMNDVLAKPIVASQLLAKIVQWSASPGEVPETEAVSA
jgi:PAS domain S-box-containing protein